MVRDGFSQLQVLYHLWLASELQEFSSSRWSLTWYPTSFPTLKYLFEDYKEELEVTCWVDPFCPPCRKNCVNCVESLSLHCLWNFLKWGPPALAFHLNVIFPLSTFVRAWVRISRLVIDIWGAAILFCQGATWHSRWRGWEDQGKEGTHVLLVTVQRLCLAVSAPGPRLGADVPVPETACAEESQPRRLGREAKCWSTLGATKATTVLTESA